MKNYELETNNHHKKSELNIIISKPLVQKENRENLEIINNQHHQISNESNTPLDANEFLPTVSLRRYYCNSR